MDFTIRTMQEGELGIAVQWAKQEGWNPGLHDTECFYEVDPNGFFIGLLDDVPIATMSMVKYGTDYAFGGFYIVKPEYRGKGYGMQIFKEALVYAVDRNIGGDGVIENLDKYAAIGGKLAHYNARYQFLSQRVDGVPETVVEAKNVPFEKLNKYDQSVFGYERAAFLKLWISRPSTRAFVSLAQNQITGYGVVRKCYSGYKIGPLFADNQQIAQDVFVALANSVESNVDLYWDVAKDCCLVPVLSKEFAMQEVFATGRMYTKAQPNFPREKWFGITSFELG